MLLETVLSLSATSWLLVIVGVVTLIYFLTSERDNRKLPPSPGLALPIVGHLFLVERNPIQQLQKWRERLGDIFMLRMGSTNMVFLNGHDVLKEALVKKADVFSDRPPSALRHVFPDVHNGVIAASGPNWKEQRTTSLAILREFGMGKNILADKIAEEVDVYVNELLKHKGQPTELRKITNMSVSNVICAIIFGRRYELNDKRFAKMMDIFNELVKTSASTSAFQFFPFLLYSPIDFVGVQQLIAIIKESRDFTESIVKERLEGFDPEVMDSFVAAYRRDMEKKQDSGVHTYLDEKNLTRVIANLFVAGTETTASTILWCYLFLLHHPDVQEKIYKEICEHIGTHRVPTMQDKPKLKYLQAVIYETLRLANIVPLSLTHMVTEDTELRGYVIPKGAIVVPNLYSALMDEKVWGDPQNFRPERFLDSQGNIVKKEELIPFSLGRRVCLGEALAQMELILYLSTMFQRFEFLPADPSNLPPINGVFGVTMPPEAFQIRCVERKQFNNNVIRND
ncbi:cytochrome P450 2U1 [Aplysia californica]|uniref:Cytochrome P450 2U1 n=1 Tax=Aplysia californica TaxID=6500 RepID=A0ABM0K8I5_APLCA|nr:cytochrome P450 2U1 [Aplysia californica]